MSPILALLLLCQLALYTTETYSKECGRPVLRDGMEIKELQRIYSPGDTIVLSCKKGYTPTSAYRNIVCSANGDWTQSKLQCLPKTCSFPENPDHGDMEFVDIVYQSTISFTCHEGYTLQGASTTECMADGEWSEPPPKCSPLTCGLPQIPAHGKIVYDRHFSGNTVRYGFGVTYKCRPPLALIGNERGVCSSNGKWTEPPECRLVTCPPPKNISNGYMTTVVKREHGYKDTVRYGCNIDYTLDGPMEVECQQTGDWSERPACCAPCMMELTERHFIKNVLWTGKPIKILHKNIITFNCINKEKLCSYAVSSQCIDGNLTFPKCVEETNAFAKEFNATSLPPVNC